MKKIAFMLISLYMGLMGANAQSNKYDLNEDGDVNVTDVTLLVSKILAQNEESGYDLNDDEDVNITDVILMVNYILGLNNGNQGGGNGGGIGDTSQAYLVCPDDNHPHMIDLGLPSGTKWACCNVGATIPEGYGGYYSWGETEEKEHYGSHYYKYAYEDNEGEWWDGETQRNYSCISLGIDISGTDYDVAHVRWGGNWCMPSKNDFQELLDNCTYEWKTLNDVKGELFTSNINGGTIFLPLAGSRWYGGLDTGDLSYWSSTQNPTKINEAYILFYLWDGLYNHYSSDRRNGKTVRPVMK